MLLEECDGGGCTAGLVGNRGRAGAGGSAFGRTGAGGLDGEVGYAGAVGLAGGGTGGAARLAGFWEGGFEGLLVGGGGGARLFWFKLVGEVSPVYSGVGGL